MAERSRWKSWVLWSSIGTTVVLILQALGVWAKVGIDQGLATQVVTGILGVISAVGIINNPTDSTNW